MLKSLLRILPAVSLALCAVHAATPAPADQAASFPAQTGMPVIGTLRSGIEFAGETVDGDFSALVPLHSSLGRSGTLGGSLLFAEPYGEWVEQGSMQAGIGLGFRHLFNKQPLSALQSLGPAGFLDEGVYFGANVFLDMADTRYDQRFWQLGIGAEVGSRYLDLRGRYHVPLDDGEQSRLRSVTTYQQNYEGSLQGGTRFVASSRVTVDSLFTFLTEGLEGWDAEASVLVPGLDRWVDLRLIGGYASFHSPTFDYIDYDTWKAGIEFRPVPAVVLSGMWFENERIVGDNWLFGISLELPFETADIGDGKGGFWGHIKDAFKSRRRHLAERMTEPARRHSLPMQLGTGLESLKTKVKYQTRAAIILPDGRVVTVLNNSGSASSSYSSASMTLVGAGTLRLSGSNSFTGATTVNAGFIQMDTVNNSSTGVLISNGPIESGSGSSGSSGTGATTLPTGGTNSTDTISGGGITVTKTGDSLALVGDFASLGIDLRSYGVPNVTADSHGVILIGGSSFSVFDWISLVNTGTIPPDSGGTGTGGTSMPELKWDTSTLISSGTANGGGGTSSP